MFVNLNLLNNLSFDEMNLIMYLKIMSYEIPILMNLMTNDLINLVIYCYLYYISNHEDLTFYCY